MLIQITVFQSEICFATLRNFVQIRSLSKHLILEYSKFKVTIVCNKDSRYDKIYYFFIYTCYENLEASVKVGTKNVGTDIPEQLSAVFLSVLRKRLRARNFCGPSTSSPGRICRSWEFPPDSRLDFHAMGCRAREDAS
jgi:hypothetical protein